MEWKMEYRCGVGEKGERKSNLRVRKRETRG